MPQGDRRSGSAHMSFKALSGIATIMDIYRLPPGTRLVRPGTR